MPSVSTPQVKFEEAGPAHKIDAVLPLTTHLVKYFDGDGKQQVRVVVMTEDPTAVFVIQSMIQGTPVVTPATDWFSKAFLSHISKGAKSV